MSSHDPTAREFHLINKRLDEAERRLRTVEDYIEGLCSEVNHFKLRFPESEANASDQSTRGPRDPLLTKAVTPSRGD